LAWGYPPIARSTTTTLAKFPNIVYFNVLGLGLFGNLFLKFGGEFL